MAKELPYFKFDVAEWISGSITLESFEVQGLFLNICAHYWFKSGQLPLTEIKRRLSKAKPAAFDTLIKGGYLKIIDGGVHISFLNEQLCYFDYLSKVNSVNGAKGGRPKTEIKPPALISVNETKANKSNLEERREEDIRRGSLEFRISLASALKKKYSALENRGMDGAGQDVDAIAFQLLASKTEQEILEQARSMIAYHTKQKWTIPTRVPTIITNLIENDYGELLRQSDPERQAEFLQNNTPKPQLEYDNIGTSDYGDTE